MLRSLQQWADRGFAFALQYAIDRTSTMLKNFLGYKGCAVAADENKAVRKLLLCCSSEVKNLRYVREVVT
jgi:hypothetical protein